MPDNQAVNVALSFLHHMGEVHAQRRTRYRAYREYYDGEHSTQLTNRQRQYLKVKHGEDFRDNFCPVVVDSLAERLIVTGFETSDDDLSATLWDWWHDSRLDAGQADIYQATLRDGDAYAIVSWDYDNDRPRIDMEPAYDGTEGVEIVYGDERGEAQYATKRWQISDPKDGGGYRTRLNIYYEDRIERYVSDSRVGGDWMKHETDDLPWWEWWTDTGAENGEPLGIPVHHFRYKATGYNWGRSRLADVIPLQNLVNKVLIDIAGAADTHGYPMLTLTGDKPSAQDVGPGRMLYSERADAKYGRIDPGDLSQLLKLKDALVMDIARVSNTPMSRFQITGQIAAEGTLKQQEGGLVADAMQFQSSTGNVWEDVMTMALQIQSVMGEVDLPEDLNIEAKWRPAATRDEKGQTEMYKIWAESFNVPDEIVWKRIGMTDDEIEMAKNSEQYQARQAMSRMGMLMNEEERGD